MSRGSFLYLHFMFQKWFQSPCDLFTESVNLNKHFEIILNYNQEHNPMDLKV